MYLQGDVYTWGHGLTGSLGHGDLKNRRQPRLVEALAGQRVSQLACAGPDTPSLALSVAEDTVWQWGNTAFLSPQQLQYSPRDHPNSEAFGATVTALPRPVAALQVIAWSCTIYRLSCSRVIKIVYAYLHRVRG